MPIIKMENSTNGTLENVQVNNADVGVEAINSSFRASKMDFHDVGQAWKVDGSSSADIRESRVTQSRKTNHTDSKTSKGWTPSSAPYLPIYCSSCGAISPSHHHQFRGFYFNLWGKNEEPCPKCGAPAKLSEGAFNLSREVVEILKAPEMTHVMLAGLLNIGSEFAAGRISPEVALQEVERTAPGLAAVVKKAAVGGIKIGAAIMGALVIANTYHDFAQNFGIDPVRSSVDFILDRLPTLDLPRLKEAMEQHPPK